MLTPASSTLFPYTTLFRSTAEPYYAVRQPSNVVVIENVVRADTKGTTEAMDTKYELMERGGYIPTGYKFDPVVLSTNLDRKSTRLNSSHQITSYAVFCLKK